MNPLQLNIAIAEDDILLADLLAVWLQQEQHSYQHRMTGADMIELLKAQAPFHLVIIDWNLPDISGLALLRWIRQHLGWCPAVLFMTGRNAQEDIVQALHEGADDYLVKPVYRDEVLARIQALARRCNAIHPDTDLTTETGFCIDQQNHCIRYKGQPIALTHREYTLAVYFFRRIDQIVSREELLREVWGIQTVLDTRSVDMCISRMRKKLQLGERGLQLKSIYLHGYRLERILT